MKLWRFPQACAGSVTVLKCPIVHRVFYLGGKAQGEYGEPLWCLGRLVRQTAPIGISIHKGVNFGIHLCLLVPQLFLYLSSFTYAIYFVIAFMLEVIYLAIT
jgi:hypothetical protein